MVPWLSIAHVAIGGIQVNGLGASDIDNQVEFQNSTTLGGLNLELHQRISDHYGRRQRLDQVVREKLKDPDVWRFESRVAEQVIAQWLAEYPSVTIIKVSRRIGKLVWICLLMVTLPHVKSRLLEDNAVARDGSSIKSIRLENQMLITGKV